MIDVVDGFGEMEGDRWEEVEGREMGHGQTEQAFKLLTACVFGDIFWIRLCVLTVSPDIANKSPFTYTALWVFCSILGSVYCGCSCSSVIVCLSCTNCWESLLPAAL